MNRDIKSAEETLRDASRVRHPSSGRGYTAETADTMSAHERLVGEEKEWHANTPELPRPDHRPPQSYTRIGMNESTAMLVLIYEKLDELIQTIRSL